MRFWHEPDSPLLRKPDGLKPLFRAIGDAATLKYLGGGGPGCFYPEEAPSNLRRVFHSFVVLGFLLDFVSTSLAFVYEDFLKILPPYDYFSAPVIFGTVGGVFLVVGAIGLLSLKIASDRELGNPIAYSLDYAFLLTLWADGPDRVARFIVPRDIGTWHASHCASRYGRCAVLDGALREVRALCLSVFRSASI